MPRYRRHFRPGQIVFLTIATAAHAPWMATDAIRGQVLEALRATRGCHPFAHFGHVLLPDHLHLLIRAAARTDPSAIVGCFKRAALVRIRGRHLVRHSNLWQRRFHDHVIRDEGDFARHLDYLHFNPVKHGWVTCAEHWPWSSLAAWQRRGVYAPGWGCTEPPNVAGMRES